MIPKAQQFAYEYYVAIEPKMIATRTAQWQIELSLPWPPSLNRIWRAINNRILLSAEARTFHRAAKNALPPGRTPKPLTGRLAVQITLCPPKHQQDAVWDIANREKLICDTLTKQRIWEDDSQIDWLLLVRGSAFASGRAIVSIAPYPFNATTEV
jgi:crossover junction endodeoxyribonuclease RusA